MSIKTNGSILKILLKDTVDKLGISDARLRANIHHMFSREVSAKTKESKINEAVGNYITAIKSGSISWNMFYVFLRSLRVKRIEISIKYFILADKEVEVKRAINFNLSEKIDDEK